MQRKLTLFFLALYPVAPSFFKILGLDSGVILAIAYCCSIYFIIGISQKKIKIYKKDATLLLICFLFIMIPLIAHGDFFRLIRDFLERVVLVLVLVDFFKNNNNVEKSLKILIIVALVFSIIGIIESLTATNVFTILYNSSGSDIGPELQYRGGIARSETVFGHAITYGVYLTIMALLTSMKINESKSKLFRLSYLFIIVNLILTISRVPIIVFFFMQLLLLFFFGKKLMVKSIIKGIAIAIAVMIIASLIPGLLNIIQTSLLAAAAVFSENALNRVSASIGTGNPFAYRLELLNTIPQYIEGHYLLGRGINYTLTFTMFGHHYYSIDNAILVWMLHHGILGAIGYILPSVLTLVFGIKCYIKDRNDKIAICLALCAAAHILDLLSVAQMGEYRIVLILFALSIAHYNNFYKRKMLNGNHSSVVVRPSGTESKLKTNIAVSAKDESTAKVVEQKIVEELKERIILGGNI